MTYLGDILNYFRMEIDIDLNGKTINVQKSTYLKKILG